MLLSVTGASRLFKWARSARSNRAIGRDEIYEVYQNTNGIGREVRQKGLPGAVAALRQANG